MNTIGVVIRMWFILKYRIDYVEYYSQFGKNFSNSLLSLYIL